jgi:cytochrome c-type biogenesis protein CcmH/NrfG
MRTALAVGMLVAATGSADQIDARIAEARGLLGEDKPAAALERLAGLDIADPRVGLVAGVAHYHAGDAVKAIAALEPLARGLPGGSPERREAVQVLGLSNVIAGRYAEAVPLLEETRLWAADNLELSQILGNAYIQTQQADNARACFAQAFGVPGDSAAAHLMAAQMMVRVEQENLAEAELRQAVAKDPRLPQAHFLLGQIALFRGRLEEAIELTRREIALNPGHATAWSQLGDAYVRRQAWDEAAGALQRSIWINPYYSAPYILLGRTYMKKAQPATAEAMLRRAVEYDPNNKAAHYLLGQVLQQLGRTEEANKELETAARLQGQPGR